MARGRGGVRSCGVARGCSVGRSRRSAADRAGVVPGPRGHVPAAVPVQREPEWWSPGLLRARPDLSGIARPTQPLYVIFDDTATQDHCDGQPNVFRHDHVLPVAPGDRGYTGAWTLVLLVEATPGSIDLASTPFTTAAQVQAALATGTLVDVTSVLAPGGPVNMIAPVIGGS